MEVDLSLNSLSSSHQEFLRDAPQYVTSDPYVDSEGILIVTRYQQVKNLINRPELSLDLQLHAKSLTSSPIEFNRSVTPWLQTMPPEQHLILRKQLLRVFARFSNESLPHLLPIYISNALQTIGSTSSSDFLNDYAIKIPAQIAYSLLGIPKSDMDMLLKLYVGGVRTFDVPMQKDADYTKQQIELVDYFSRILHEEYHDGTVLELFTKQLDGIIALSESEKIANMIVLSFGGWETTSSAIASALLVALAMSDHVLHTVDLDLFAQEILRLYTPTQWVYRKALVSKKIDDLNLEEGQLIKLCLGAANRDPLIFSQPDQFKLRANNNLAFGFGSHHCIGSVIAQREMRDALIEFINWKKGKNIRSLEVERKDEGMLRTITKLHIDWT